MGTLFVRRIETLCANGRIEGATRIGYFWAIPDDAVKPRDMRVKSMSCQLFSLACGPKTGLLL